MGGIKVYALRFFEVGPREFPLSWGSGVKPGLCLD